jgi:two-component system, LuxR family, response regulator FixJ
MTSIPPTVFVVDDDASFLPAVTRLLRAGGYAVKTFASAGEFVKSAPPDSAGCVIADLHMPGMNGLDLQEVLARNGSPLPVIFLTGQGDIPTSVHAMRNGAEDFLTKPVKREKLFEAVQRALDRNNREREAQARNRELRALFDTLTPREREVLKHVVTGRLNKQIAADLGTSERTIKAHRANLMAKLRVKSVAELVRRAQVLGI